MKVKHDVFTNVAYSKVDEKMYNIYGSTTTIN